MVTTITAAQLAAEAHTERCHEGYVREWTPVGVVRVPCVLCPAGTTASNMQKMHIAQQERQ